MAALLGDDDQTAKRDRKTVDHRRSTESLRYVGRHLRPDGSPMQRATQLVELVRQGIGGSEDMHALRCERGAQVALSIELDTATAAAIRALDEHWDGGGVPNGLAQDDIPLLGRILGLAQTVEVFVARDGVPAALAIARERSGRWFDPALVDVLLRLEHDDAFWTTLRRTDPQELVRALEPEDRVQVAESDRLDRVAEAFAGIVDAKSPYTGRHSEGVARIATSIGEGVGLVAADLLDLRRAALLHDLGKLAISNRILDKPGRLTEGEWAAMRRHPELTERILLRISAFRDLAPMAGAHHERLDGSGYHRGLRGPQLAFSARILAVADVFEALTAARPYRGPLEPDEALGVMRADVPDRLDGDAFAALEEWVRGPRAPVGAMGQALVPFVIPDLPKVAVAPS